MSSSLKARRVCVLGLGLMGSALAEALLREGHEVTVWNRTAEKAAPLTSLGAALASSAEEALEGSEVTFVCVTSHAVTMDILGRLRKASYGPGRTLIQLTTMTAPESQALAEWAAAKGLAYLEGSIVGVPENVRAKTATIILSGPKASFEACKALSEAFGPSPLLSEEIGAAVTFDRVYYAFTYGALQSFLLGAALCQAKGFAPEVYIDTVLSRWSVVSDRFRAMGLKAAEGDHRATQASLAIWAGGYEGTLALCEETGVDATLSHAVTKNFERAIAAGYGGEELTALVKVFLPDSESEARGRASGKGA